MPDFAIRPHAVSPSGDDRPAGSLYRYIWRMSGRHQVWICLLAGVVASLSMVPLELQRRIINDAVNQENLRRLLWLGGAYLGVVLLQTALKYGLRIYQGWLGESAIRHTREHLASLQECRGATRGDAHDGRAVSVIGTEVERLGGFVGEGLSQPVVNLGMIAAIMGYMIAVEPLIAAFSLVFLVPQALAVPPLQHRLNRLVEGRVRRLRGLGDLVAELGETDTETRLPRQLDRIFANRMRIYLLKFALKGLVNLLNQLAPLAALVVGGYLVIHDQTTVGVVVAFISGFERLAAPLRELIGYYRVAARARVQHDMIAQWM